MTQKYIVGNWKMNGSIALIEQFRQNLEQYPLSPEVQMMLAPPSVYLNILSESLSELPVWVAAQNVHDALEGAKTGEVSVAMLKEVGCRAVILGHSERRQYFGDNDAWIARKVRTVQDGGLISILCVGETQQQREKGETLKIVREQLEKGLKDLPSRTFTGMIAYEPVWAIGTGLTATPEQAQEVHKEINSYLTHNFDRGCDVPVLYGGSVNSANAKALFMKPEIHGALVGGASLKVDAFLQIYQAMVEVK